MKFFINNLTVQIHSALENGLDSSHWDNSVGAYYGMEGPLKCLHFFPK